MSKLESLCIDATDIDTGLEYLPDSLIKIYTDPHNKPNAKVAQLRERLRPYDYNLKSWQIINKSYPNLVIKKTELETQIQAVTAELAQTKQNNSDKTSKITRLESELSILKTTHSKLQRELEKEKNNHQNTKDTHQLQLADLATIIFPSSSINNNLGFTDLKTQAQANKTKLQDLKTVLSAEQKASRELAKKLVEKEKEIAQLKEQLDFQCEEKILFRK